MPMAPRGDGQLDAGGVQARAGLVVDDHRHQLVAVHPALGVLEGDAGEESLRRFLEEWRRQAGGRGHESDGVRGFRPAASVRGCTGCTGVHQGARHSRRGRQQPRHHHQCLAHAAPPCSAPPSVGPCQGACSSQAFGESGQSSIVAERGPSALLILEWMRHPEGMRPARREHLRGHAHRSMLTLRRLW